MTGTNLTGFALGVSIFRQDGAVTDLSLFFLATLMPATLCGPLWGSVVDRWTQQRALLLSHTICGACTMAIAALIWLDALALAPLLGLVTLSSVFNGLQYPAFSAATTVLVHRDDLTKASGLVQLGVGFAQLVAPALAGVLLDVIELDGILLIDVATFSVAIALIASRQFPRPRASATGRKTDKSWWANIVFGWTYLRGKRGLLVLLGIISNMNFNTGAAVILLTPIILGLGSVGQLGLVMSLAGAGMLVGSIAMVLVHSPRRLIRTIMTALVAQSVFIGLIAWQSSIILVSCSAFGCGVTFPVIWSCHEAFWQRKVAPDVQGRVAGFRALLTRLPYPLAMLVAGPLVDRFLQPALASDGSLAHSVGAIVGVGPGRGAALGLLGLALVTTLATLAAYAYRPVRQLEQALPDHTPLFGQAGLDLGLITRNDIWESLWWQQVYRRTLGRRRRIGDIMVARGILRQEEADRIAQHIDSQADVGPGASGPIPMPSVRGARWFPELTPTAFSNLPNSPEELKMLGDILVELKFCTQEQVMAALDVQRVDRSVGAKKHLGETMIDEGLLSVEQLKTALEHLYERRGVKSDRVVTVTTEPNEGLED